MPQRIEQWKEMMLGRGMMDVDEETTGEENTSLGSRESAIKQHIRIRRQHTSGESKLVTVRVTPIHNNNNQK